MSVDVPPHLLRLTFVHLGERGALGSFRAHSSSGLLSDRTDSLFCHRNVVFPDLRDPTTFALVPDDLWGAGAVRIEEIPEGRIRVSGYTDHSADRRHALVARLQRGATPRTTYSHQPNGLEDALSLLFASFALQANVILLIGQSASYVRSLRSIGGVPTLVVRDPHDSTVITRELAWLHGGRLDGPRVFRVNGPPPRDEDLHEHELLRMMLSGELTPFHLAGLTPR